MRTYKIILVAALAAAVIFTGAVSGMRLLQSREAAAMGLLPTTVVIDAGHGGEDGGATSVSGVLESQINLDIAKRMEDFLAFNGIGTRMVRDRDVAIYDASAKTISQKKVSDLKNRVKLVNETPNALLLSIHQNRFSDGRYSGAQVFYAKTAGSQELADQTQQILIDAVDPQNHRKAKPASTVYLMNNISCTGILVECGFLSNKTEDQKLQDAAYQKKLTVAIGYSMADWINKGTGANEV